MTSIIKRSRKSLSPPQEMKTLLSDLAEHLDVGFIQDYACFKYPSLTVSLDHCNLKCNSPCDQFESFQHVTNLCEEQLCRKDDPCLDCMLTIENCKWYSKALYSLKTIPPARLKLIMVFRFRTLNRKQTRLGKVYCGFPMKRKA